MIDERGMFMGKLAITGGPKLRTKPFPQWPVYGKEEADGLLRVLESQKWGTLGPEVAKFTERFCNYLGVKHGVAVTNGTATMEVLLRAKGIGFGDEVLVPPYTFVATVSAVICVGATPVFVDIEEDTFNMDPDKLEQAITPRTKAVIPVHVGGRPCDMDKIMAIANKYNLFVIEDTAHAHGSEWKGQKCGSLGTAGSFSFQASKNLTAGEGGFISTNDTDLFEMCWSIHHCGRDYKGTVWYGHPYIGTNARMTEWQAVILNAQLDRMDSQIEKRMENAKYLTARLNEIDCIQTVKEDERITRNSYHLFLFKYLEENLKGLHQKLPIADYDADTLSHEIVDEELDYKVVKTKKFPMKPMSVEEAILQMNLLGHQFYMFKNAETDEVNVVYVRKDKNYGLIEPEM